MNLLNDIRERLSIFIDFYDNMILINPKDYAIIDIYSKTNSKKRKQTISLRYTKLLNDNKCNKNCIIFKAYKTNKTSVKLELGYNKTLFTIATPIIYDYKKYIIVLEKYTSNNNVVLDDPEYTKLKNSYYNLNNILNKDVLTNIYNKRAINKRLSRRLSQDNIPVSIIMLDIDHFKNINDTYGHIIGDKVLIEFCNIVSSCIRKDESFFGRFGGDEFIIILEKVSLDIANKIANRIRKKVESHIFTYDDISLKLTCSLGGYVIDDASLKIKDFVKIADKNLYSAKNSGRNNIMLLSALENDEKS